LKTRALTRYIVLAIPLLLLAAFILLPVTLVVINGLLGQTLGEVFSYLSSPLTQFTVAFTFEQAIISTAFTLLVGLPGGLILGKLRFRGRSVVRALLIVPFVLPPIVVVVGFLQMFGEYGILDSFLMTITGSQTSVFNLATGLPGILLAHTFYNAPLVMLLVAAAMEGLSPEVEESAELLGASPWQKFKRITMPHILPSLTAAGILTFLFCFMSFPIVLAFGEGRLRTVEYRIWDAFRTAEYGDASLLVILQIAVTLVLALAYIRIGRNSQEGETESSRVRRLELSDSSIVIRAGVVVYLVIILVLVAGPILSIARSAVFDPVSRTYELEGFAYLVSWAPDGGLRPLINSLFYAGLATLFAVLLGIPLAYAHKSKSNILPTLSSTMILLPLGISSITIAYGLMRVIAVPTGLNVNPWPLIVVAQTVIGLPFSARAIEISLRSINPEVLEQADSLGASRLQRLFFVEIPLLAPGIIVGAVFAFAMAIGEMSATLLIALPQNYTLAVAIINNINGRDYTWAGSSALLLVIVCVIAFIVIERISEGSSGGIL
jgi:thiamine transport system permease protein